MQADIAPDKYGSNLTGEISCCSHVCVGLPFVEDFAKEYIRRVSEAIRSSAAKLFQKHTGHGCCEEKEGVSQAMQDVELLCREERSVHPDHARDKEIKY